MSNYRWAGLPEPNDLEFNAKVKEIIEVLVSKRGQGVFTLPGGIQEAVERVGRQASDTAIEATTDYIAEKEGTGSNEIIFKNVFDPITYAGYEFSFLAVRPVDPAHFDAQVSTDSGVTWDAGPNYPRFLTGYNLTQGTAANAWNAAGTVLRFTTATVQAGQFRALTGWARLMIPPSPSSVIQMTSKTQHSDGTDFFATEGRMYYTQNTALVNAIQFRFNAQAFNGGRILMRGIRRK